MNTNLKSILCRQAISHRMCRENRVALDNIDDLDSAIALYKKTIDWALEKGYPSMDVLKEYFMDSQSNGIFVCQEFEGELLKGNEVYVFHNCKGTLKTGLNVQRRIIPMLYFANGCDMTIVGEDEGFAIMPTIVPLYVFGENKISTIPSKSVQFDIKKKEINDKG